MTAVDRRMFRVARSALPPLSLRDRAYAEIKRRINRMDYRPGAYLNEAQISRVLKIGRTPVHQALDRLMLDGQVQVIPRKGVIVEYGAPGSPGGDRSHARAHRIVSQEHHAVDLIKRRGPSHAPHRK